MAQNLEETGSTKPRPPVKPYTPEIKRFLSLWEKDPKSRVFAPLAETLRREGFIDKAIEVCMKGLEIHPNYVSGRVALGRAYFDRRDFENARKNLELVFEADPENLVAANTLGQIYETQGELDKALLCYKLALYSSPGAKDISNRVNVIESLLGPLAQELKAPARKEDDKKRRVSAVPKIKPEAQTDKEPGYKKPQETEGKSEAEKVETSQPEVTLRGEARDLEDEKVRLSGKIFSRKPRHAVWRDEIEKEIDKFFEGADADEEWEDEDFEELSEELDAATIGSPSSKFRRDDQKLKLAYTLRAIKVYEEFNSKEPDNLQAMLRLKKLKKKAIMMKRELYKPEKQDEHSVEDTQEIIKDLHSWLVKIRE